MPDDKRSMQVLLLRYFAFLAERHGYGPGDNFEYALWDDLDGVPPPRRLVSNEEAAKVTRLAMATDSWVTYDVEAGMFKVIDMDEWMALLEKRGH
jgi:hypothetical protein